MSQLRIGVELDLPGVCRAADHVRLARAAENATLDFVALADAFDLRRDGAARLDAVTTLSMVAAATSSIGLLPTVTTTHTEPFHVSAAIATLDWVSDGRAGWRPRMSNTAAEAGHFGAQPFARTADVLAETEEYIDVVARLWDSWEDGAEIRDVATGRFIDRDRLHHIDFAGRFLSIQGPAFVPRPPQGHPVVAIELDQPGLLPIAARHADVAIVDCVDEAEARSVRARLRGAAESAGRDPDHLKLLVKTGFAGDGNIIADRFTRWFESGAVDGFQVGLTSVAEFADSVLPLLRERGLYRSEYSTASMRRHLGLPARAANRYVEAGA